MKKAKSLMYVFAALAIFCLVQAFGSEVSSVVYRMMGNFVLSKTVLAACLNIAGILILVCLCSRYILKCSARSLYLGKPLPTVKWCVAAVLMPTAMCIFYILFTGGAFYRETLSPFYFAYAVCYTLISAGLRSGICEEVIFRGMMLNCLQKAWGKVPAALLSSLLFFCVHLGNADPSDWRNVLSLFAAFMIAGIALSLVVYETGSIWSSVVIHAMYNILSGDAYLLHISTERSPRAIWNYTFQSSNRLLTGIPNAEELETGLPAMIGFLIILVMAAVSLKKKAQRS